ncbi:hypothetical protein LIER_27848 [Lithospermum erythrorhizon]|uniref:non-specific serine/threonine protein kinase n=1 Tax=Lithospermum erythrorhizon TaxID=34254 RepID=A0AAV3RJH7_LITER
MNKKKLIPSCNLALLNYLVSISIISGSFQLLQVTQAQPTLTPTNVSTDPSEAAILNKMFERWGISAASSWNISGELCSGAAIDSTLLQTMSPGIKCDCNSNRTCHITGLRVYDLDVIGAIPDELWNLTFIDDLDLRVNFFTGPISPAIGRLNQMKYLALGNNALSGPLPSEIGSLNQLISLGLGLNNFSGPLPSSFGNLTKLTQIFIASMGLTGTIPSTFADLRSLGILQASDNALTGRIPDFIGNMELRVLRLQGNAFEGPIPASFSNLTTIEELMVSDLSNGSSSLDFLLNLKSLNRLVLRNNNISGSIPSNIGEYRNLTQLDLSFNNLTGSIPESLLNMSSLVHLFLGSNKLVGPLPAQRSTSLHTIDLSYNELSGGFPSWVSQNNMNLNLVANNFTMGDPNSSNLPRGLNCIQRNFPCNRGSPIYSSFAIKCGGAQIRSSDQILYETDNETLGPANFYMTSTSRWAVSNVGLPTDATNPLYKSVSFGQYGNTNDSELFQSARLSAGSLRYYGLGLENGNYTLNLQFAEGLIQDPPLYESTGRRMFDVYIQVCNSSISLCNKERYHMWTCSNFLFKSLLHDKGNINVITCKYIAQD